MPPVGEIRAGPFVGVVAQKWAEMVRANSRPEGVGFMLTVENYTTNTLTSHKKEENTGFDSSWHFGLQKLGFEKLYKIEPSTSGAILGMNDTMPSQAYTGTTGTVSWTIGKTNKMLVVMYSVPWDRNLYSNWCGVGIFDVGDTRANFDTMYYKSADTLFDKKEFYHNLDPFVFKGAEGFDVEAEMDASHMSKIMVKLYRR